MLSKTWKISRTVILSALLASCAGKPPAMERKVIFYGGVPEREAMCRNVTRKSMAKWIQAIAQHSRTRAYAEKAVEFALAADAREIECIKADTPGFAKLIGMPADDLRVLLQHIENLIYSCERWKQ